MTEEQKPIDMVLYCPNCTNPECDGLCVGGSRSVPEQKPTNQTTMNHEQWLAIREGHLNAASAEYFGARPRIDNPANRRIFYAGHCKGYDAATPVPAPAEQVVTQTIDVPGLTVTKGYRVRLLVESMRDLIAENNDLKAKVESAPKPEIEAHNAEVERKKAEKKAQKQIARGLRS